MSGVLERIRHKSGVLGEIQQTMAASELVAAVGSLHRDSESLLYGNKVRILLPGEIDQLEWQRNRATDWMKLRVVSGFRPEQVWNNQFLGRVVLGVFSGLSRDLGDGVSLPSGVYNSTLSDSEIANEAVVHRVGLLNRTLLQTGAAAVNTSCVTCGEQTSFGCGTELPLGIETGGREVRSYGEITVGIAQQLATRRDDKRLLAEYARQIDEYVGRVRCPRTVLAPGAVIRDSNQIVGCYLGSHAVVSGAGKLTESCLLSSAEEPAVVGGGASVSRSIVQWGAEVDSMSIVDRSVLCEYSHVDRHGKVTGSILGPNTGVGEGEVTASLVGPFVGFHHQALLIAAVWPEGKGNVGYGANVGSNHTGRAPDQEIWCGEGTFFGLGVNVKFPADFTRSPYSILASGVNCLSQKVEFPFSLINTPSRIPDDIPPSFNEIFPAWVLAENIYMIKRNEGKYQKRNKARRETFVFDVFRPEIIELMRDAEHRLSQVHGKSHYSANDIPGLGKNFATDAAIRTAIKTYHFYVGYYARRGLFHRLICQELKARSPEAQALLTEPSDRARWEQQRQILGDEESHQEVPALLEELVARERHIAEQVERVKAKDDARGRKVIPDYEASHQLAASDGFIRETWARFDELAAEVERLLAP